MSDDSVTTEKLTEFKTTIERIVGEEITGDPDQLVNLAYPVGSSYYEEGGQATWYRIFFPGKFCVNPVTLLDASGHTSTGADGTRVFLLSTFICSALNYFSAPVFLLATPKTASPCYVTLAHQIVPDPNNPGYNDVQITAYSWGPTGAAAPDIPFDWRCRVVSNPIIE
jgi:hypothetical protein